ncbi:MORN repeat-containing protein 1-like [Chiloscyllium plagiosum]|uniref:MORN repeat-containing protein 1-like n=1 Tax=Chiloscyllium plagiosum TaxID=36176 RepID=UPI001CB887A6|nr:MORN repeat-containing protein 1-like [Chiloscyllium plagiosum]
MSRSQFTPAVEKESSVPPNQRTENGYAVFCNIAFALPDNYQPLDELEKKTSKRLSSRTTVSQEKISESRSEVSIKLSGKSKKKQNVTDPQIVKPGDYVIMVKDVTTPPFLDRTLPPAFILLKVKPHKASKKSSRKEHQKVSNK